MRRETAANLYFRRPTPQYGVRYFMLPTAVATDAESVLAFQPVRTARVIVVDLHIRHLLEVRRLIRRYRKPAEANGPQPAIDSEPQADRA